MRTGIILGVIVLLVLIVGAGAVTVVPAGHTGVVVTMGKVSDRVLDEECTSSCPLYSRWS